MKFGSYLIRALYAVVLLGAFGLSASDSVVEPDLAQEDALITSSTSYDFIGDFITFPKTQNEAKLDASVFGDEIDLYSGGVIFKRSDVRLEPVGDLDIRYTLSYAINMPQVSGWLEEIPRVQSSYGYSMDLREQFTQSKAAKTGHYCSTDYTIEGGSAYRGPRSFYSTPTLIIPGKINERLLIDDNPLSPGTNTFITKSGWSVACFNSQESGVEGFVAQAPNGTKYYFDVYGNRGGVAQTSRTKLDKFTLQTSDNDLVDVTDAVSFTQVNESLFVSKIEDRFGNWATFEYTPLQYYKFGVDSSDKLISNQLKKISTSDGQQIIIDFDGVNKTVTANGRQWQYAFIAEDKFKVILPSEREWIYDFFPARAPFSKLSADGLNCKVDKHPNNSEMVTIQHPTGAVGTFSFNLTRVDLANRHSLPYCISAFSLREKKISYDTNKHDKWSFEYSGNKGQYFNSDITEEHKLQGVVPSNIDRYLNKKTTITLPDLTSVAYFINRNEESSNFGATHAVQHFDKAAHLKREIQLTYQLIPNLGSKVPGWYWDVGLQELHSQKAELTLDSATGDAYLSEYQDFNFFGQPSINYQKFTSGNSSTKKEKYYRYSFVHDYDHWVLNQLASTEVSSDGADNNYTEVSKTTYKDVTYVGQYTNQLLPDTEFQYGQRIKTYHSYDRQGNIQRVEFNQPRSIGTGNRFIEYTHYKRGQPQKITVPSRTGTGSISALRTFDDNGWVTSETDYNGVTTAYKYDVMGRLVSIDLANDISDGNNWLDTHFQWNDVTNTRRISRCTLNSTKTACVANTIALSVDEKHDALLRLTGRILEDKVSGNTGSHLRYQNFAYDYNNRQVFTSFLSDSHSEARGTSTTYDALGRIETIHTSGSGTITYAYLAGNKVKTTDAKSNDTTTTYLAYGAPEYQQITSIASPEGVTTDIAINLFGNITSVKQAGTQGYAVEQFEYRAYDAQQRLCQIKRTDVGATVIGRNALGEITWQADGQTATSNNACNTSAVVGDKITFTYDNLGSQHTISYGDGTPTRTFTRDNNGNITSIAGGGYRQSYQYNNQGLLAEETLELDGKVFVLNYGYDALGSLSRLAYPGGELAVDFAPNSFGQATQASWTKADQSTYNFVKPGASYYPNGSIDSFTYGNGIIHKTTLNSRQLPQQLHDYLGSTDKIKLGYSYDNNNNITRITNGVDSNFSLSALTYDGLDRLTGTTGGAAIGSSSLSYDGLGNIRRYSNTSSFNPSNLTYGYNSSMRLNSLTGSGSEGYNFGQNDSYDSRGNVTDNGKRSFQYNLAGQMITSGSNRYLYDGYNRRIKTTDSKGASYSLYSQSGRLMYRETVKGGINYIFLGDKLVAKQGSGVVTKSDDPDYNSVMSFKPFGEAIEAPNDEVGYTGHKFDTDLGLSYMQARYYDPVIGRFYSNDPKGFRDIHSFNRYTYANNNPYKYLDPDGMAAENAMKAGMAFRQSLSPGTQKTVAMVAGGAMVGGTAIAASTTVALAVSTSEIPIAISTAEAPLSPASAVNGVKLEKQLASQSQLTELAEGGGTVISQPAKQANRIAAQTGVEAKNVQKVSSDAHIAKDGSQVQTHSFRDADTNQLIEPKTIVDENN
ncbi:RHS repeat domain-containing protein [Thalassomonas haliotis]|uniref:RHS repeat-associated core domain-containing protein n=1 Tax=Thalassomonas haliotis TaxID=485448 RepID=A0ABY7VF39_9GAMM|nr:RHS repeat-associated core domain-containing protein [Thalassomonas haliotis]WDE11754.1 hypothetical protein H3N35_26775 [Thalassomonas haliotis]